MQGNGQGNNQRNKGVRKMKCMFCDNETCSKHGIYCHKHSTQREREIAILKNKEKMLNDNDKWGIIGINSSLESLRKLAGLKNEMPPQATDFRQLIKSITVMSKFE